MSSIAAREPVDVHHMPTTAARFPDVLDHRVLGRIDHDARRDPGHYRRPRLAPAPHVPRGINCAADAGRTTARITLVALICLPAAIAGSLVGAFVPH